MIGKMSSLSIEHPYFPILFNTEYAYFTEAHNAGFTSRNAIIDIGTIGIKDFNEYEKDTPRTDIALIVTNIFQKY